MPVSEARPALAKPVAHRFLVPRYPEVIPGLFLSRIPFATGQFGEFDAQRTQLSPCPLGVALPRHGVPVLCPCDLGRSSLQQRLRRGHVQPPERDQRRHCGVDLALGQLPIFPPELLSHPRQEQVAHATEDQVAFQALVAPRPRTGPDRSRTSGPRNSVQPAAARTRPGASSGPKSPPGIADEELHLGRG